MTDERPARRRPRVAGERGVRRLRGGVEPEQTAGPSSTSAVTSTATATEPGDALDTDSVSETTTGETTAIENEEPGAPASVDSPESGTRARVRNRRLAGLLPWILAVAAVALSVGAAMEVRAVRHDRAVVTARTASTAAARSAVQAVLSYDYRHLDSDFAAARKLLSPSFQKDYDQTTKAVEPTAKQYHAVVTADVSAAGVRNVTPDSAVVLLFVNQTSTNTKHSAPRIDQSRVRVTMVHRNGTWLLDKLEAL